MPGIFNQGASVYRFEKDLSNVVTPLGNSTAAIVVKARVPVGDLYHYQPENAGKYNLLGKTGHFNIRIYRRLPEYQWVGKYPWEAFQNQQKLKIQDEANKLLLLKNEYWHMTHLMRSSADDNDYSSGGTRRDKRRLTYEVMKGAGHHFWNNPEFD